MLKIGSTNPADARQVCLVHLACSSLSSRLAQTAFTGSAATRALLHAPRLHGVDFCASCFCHKVLRPLMLVSNCSLCMG